MLSRELFQSWENFSRKSAETFLYGCHSGPGGVAPNLNGGDRHTRVHKGGAEGELSVLVLAWWRLVAHARHFSAANLEQ